MAARSFLLTEDLSKALSILNEGSTFPTEVREARHAFSLWLEARLLQRLNAIGPFEELQPILLGSWSRHELTPKSDIDILFLGEDAKVAEFVRTCFKQGLKLRSRTPEDRADWTLGVEPFDILALHSAVALSPATQVLLSEQQKQLKSHGRKILSAIRRERDERRLRQDSVSAYLEPNLKFGAGGLRDIEQALALHRLFPQAFEGTDTYPFQVLALIKDELLFLRSHLHLLNSNDILTAQDQLELAKSFAMPSKDLMKFVQSELERASFYADYAVAICSSSKRNRGAALTEIPNLATAVNRLKKDAGLLNQFSVRRRVDSLTKNVPALSKGKVLLKALGEDSVDAFLVSLHRTRLLEMLIPDFTKIRGLVQHDHYHRYTADAHLVQTLREVQRSQSKPKTLGPLGVLTKELKRQDWLILKLTALFHDLAKGRAGDHSTEGAKLVDQYLSSWKVAPVIKEEVHWLVANHLLLSTAAFRQNPQGQSTWKRLFERGVEGHRLTLLALFTAIDIRATNPEAWTPWKSQLLLDLVKNLRSPQAVQFHAHLSYASQKKIQGAKEWLLELDPLLLESLKPKLVLEDLKLAAKATKDLKPLVVQGAKGRVWVRFHRQSDQAGLFLNFVRQLFGFGLSIQTSAVHTLKDVGVYDWFCLRTEKPARQIEKWLSLEPGQVASPQVRFQSIDVMAQEDDEWILSFKGKDQRGLLLAAAEALASEDLSVRWARVHTWGQQVEDIFSVRPSGEVQERLTRLRQRFVT